MIEHTWRELERADMDTAAAHAAEMEYRAEQIPHAVQQRLARVGHIVDGLGEVKGEIVWCMDCIRYSLDDYGYAWCAYVASAVQDDDFCAWGERNA